MTPIILQAVYRAKSGDKAAYAELYTYYYRQMYAYALYALGHPQDAEDAVAQTVYCAYTEIAKLRREESFPTWLFTILSNQVKRKKKAYVERRVQIPLEDLNELADGAPWQSEEKLDLYKALSSLKDTDRAIVLLSVVENFTGKEIAAILGMNPSTVRSRLSRSLKRLHQLLTANEESDRKGASV